MNYKLLNNYIIKVYVNNQIEWIKFLVEYLKVDQTILQNSIKKAPNVETKKY